MARMPSAAQLNVARTPRQMRTQKHRGAPCAGRQHGCLPCIEPKSPCCRGRPQSSLSRTRPSALPRAFPCRAYDIVLGRRKPTLSLVFQLMRFHVLQVGAGCGGRRGARPFAAARVGAASPFAPRPPPFVVGSRPCGPPALRDPSSCDRTPALPAVPLSPPPKVLESLGSHEDGEAEEGPASRASSAGGAPLPAAAALMAPAAAPAGDIEAGAAPPTLPPPLLVKTAAQARRSAGGSGDGARMGEGLAAPETPLSMSPRAALRPRRPRRSSDSGSGSGSGGALDTPTVAAAGGPAGAVAAAAAAAEAAAAAAVAAAPGPSAAPHFPPRHALRPARASSSGGSSGGATPRGAAGAAAAAASPSATAARSTLGGLGAGLVFCSSSTKQRRRALRVTEGDIVQWANQKQRQACRAAGLAAPPVLRSFRDPSLATGVAVLRVRGYVKGAM
jgi:hypothetical protein